MLAIIPARGGSKGLPGKNIKPLKGKPLIAYTIEAAKKAKGITRVVCSTDDAEIARVAKEAGAEVPFLRPAEFAQDASPALDAYLYTVDRLEKESGIPIEEFAVLLPTVPFRNATDIDQAIEVFRSKKAVSVISCMDAPYPLEWYLYVDASGVLRNKLPATELPKNRQESPKLFLPNGALYLFKHSVLKSKRAYYTDRTFPYVMPSVRSVDIDDILDFKWAEFLPSDPELAGLVADRVERL